MMLECYVKTEDEITGRRRVITNDWHSVATKAITYSRILI